MLVIIIQIFCKLSGQINPAAFGAFGLKDIKITLIQMHILFGKHTDFFTAEAAAV